MLNTHLVRLLLFCACLAGMAPAIATTSEEAARYYEDALQQFNRQEYKTAAIQLKNALQLDPNHLPARVLLGRVYLEKGDSPSAEKEIRLAQQLGADPGLTVLPLAEALTNQRKFQVLVDELSPAGLPPAVAVAVRVQRGNAYMELRNYAAARQEYQQALDSSPAAASPRIGMAMVALREGRFDAADGFVDEVLKQQGENADAWQAKGEIAYARGDREQAVRHYDRTLAIDPDHYAARLSRVTALMDLRRFDEVLAELRQLRETSPWDPKVSYLMGVALEHTGDADGAKAAIARAAELVNAVPDDVLAQHAQTLLLAGLINFSAGELEKAYRHLSAYIDLDPERVEPRKLLGATLLAMKEPAKAIPVLLAAVNLAPDRADLQKLLGDAYLQAGQHDFAILAFQEAERLAPGQGEVLAKMGVARLMSDDRSAGIQDMEAAIVKRPDALNIAATLAAAHMGAGNYRRAGEIAADLVQRQPNNIAFLNLLAAAQANLGDLQAARAGYERALQLNPDYRPAQINLAHLDLREGQGEQAAQRLQALLDGEPENPRLLFELAKIEQHRGRVDEAIRLLEKAHQVSPRAKYPAIRLIELLIGRGKAAQALTIAQLLKASHPEDLQVLEAVGRTHLANGEPDNAREVFRQMSSIAGYNSEQLRRVAQWQLRSNAPDDARWTLQKAVEGDPGDGSALEALADLEVRSGRLDEAGRLIAMLRKDFPERPAGPLLAGDLALRRGAPKEAEAAYREAAKRLDNDAVAIRIFRAIGQQNEQRRAIEGLAEWVGQHPQAYAAKLALAEALHGSGRLQDAKRHYEALVAQRPAGPGLLNNLANLYLALGDERALQVARQAYEAAPQVPAIIDTLGWVLVKTGSPDQGLSYLRDAISRDASSNEIRFHLGVALQELGRVEEARQQLEEVAAAPGDSPWKREAQLRLGVPAGR